MRSDFKKIELVIWLNSVGSDLIELKRKWIELNQNE